MLAVTAEQPLLAEKPKSSSIAPRPVVDDRRDAARVLRKLQVTVTPLGYAAPIVGRSRDVSEGGMYLMMPMSAAVCVGQRCEVELGPDEGVSPQPCVGPDCRYATIVRTHPITHGEAQMLGAGLRFDQPIFWD